jgi:hypothetical protein
MRAVPPCSRDRRGKEIFEQINAARGGDLFVARHSAYRAFVYANGIGDIAEGQRSQRQHPMSKEGVLRFVEATRVGDVP